ncbi:MAG: TlyA family RNA methyltransferase [Candidatus Heimdallarchaeota archaeon]
MKKRLDLILVERRLVESRTKAQWLIKNGFVYVNGIKVLKPGTKVQNFFEILLVEEFPYVGRGGLKLDAALKFFSIEVKDRICVDIGASIGGFTDCLVKSGARRVYAVDTAINLLHPSLRCENSKNKVIPLLGVDARVLDKLDDRVDLVTIDITFATIRSILPNVKKYLKGNGDIIVLVKPIFETDFYREPKFEIITDSKRLYEILMDLLGWCSNNGFFPYNILKSPLLGKGGSIEFLIHLKLKSPEIDYNYQKELMKLIFKNKSTL